jgi:hypothetical protein
MSIIQGMQRNANYVSQASEIGIEEQMGSTSSNLVIISNVSNLPSKLDLTNNLCDKL